MSDRKLKAVQRELKMKDLRNLKDWMLHDVQPISARLRLQIESRTTTYSISQGLRLIFFWCKKQITPASEFSSELDLTPRTNLEIDLLRIANEFTDRARPFSREHFSLAILALS